MLLIKGNNSNIEENYLLENETVQQYIIKGENNSYQISMDNKENLKKILIDLMIFSGDVIINFKEENENIHKYETSNKIFFSITTANITSSFLDFQVIALKHSYYSLRYTTIKKNQKESEVPNIIPNNTNFLITMYPFNEETLTINSKIIKFRNEQNNNLPFLINFYSLNCIYDFFKLNNQGEKKILKSKDGYFVQDIIKPSDERYETKEYSYITTLTSVEQGTYNKKMCMIYASSTDLENNILVGDNVPQKVIFNSGELTKIKYEYEIPDTINDLAIKFILSNRAEYQVNYYINNIDIIIRKTNISSNQQEIIESIEYSKYCSPDQENILIVEIELNNNNELNKNLELEVTIKSISSIEKYPSYLIKNKINSEFLNFQSPNYYYTDLGQKLSGEIIINYYRGNGMVFGKIVKKNKEPDSNPEWKGIYEFPKTVNGTLKYYSYLKKLSFSLEDTKDCEDECYLLINVINNISISDEYIYGKSRYFGFDILIVTNSPLIDSPNPFIILPLKQYVIGSVSQSQSSPDYKRYYMINIPYDAEKVVFDLQSENVAMYVNVYLKGIMKYEEYKYPSKTYHSWDFYSKGKPQLFELSKNDILEEANNEIDSLEEASLTVCIEAQNQDNDLSSIYALKYSLELNSALNIYELYSDQQTLCQTEKIEDKNKFRCLYIVKYNKNDIKYNILLYPIIDNLNTNYEIYADFIPKEIYDLYKQDELINLIPKTGSEFTPEKIKENFLYINLKDKGDKYLYINIETDNITVIRLLSTLSTFDYTSSPNPSTSQLYIITNNEMKFSFTYKEDIIINMESILGAGNIFWKDEESKNIIYTLQGRDDRLSLTSPPSQTEVNDQYNTLVIKNKNISSYNESQIPGGFVFFLTFYLRSTRINFDELGYGKTFNLNYRDTDFPLTLYFKLDNIKKDTNAFVTIYSMVGVKRGFFTTKEFSVYATILPEYLIYNLKSNPQIDIRQDSLVPGIYDPSKRVCLVSLKSSDMEKFSVEENENPNLVIRISKLANEGDADIYDRISIEGTVMQDDSLIPVTGKVYQHGKLKKGSEDIQYKLSTSEVQNIMYIIFSSNSDKFDFKISMDNEDTEIIDEFNKNKNNSEGRIITYIHSKPEKNNYIYLTIFKKDKAFEDENLTNYVFKYINIDDISKIKLYQIRDNSIIHLKKEDSSHLIAVEYIPCKNCFITYYVNFILRESLIQGENYDNIAVIQSNGITKEFKNKDLKVVDNKVNLFINGTNENIDTDFAYIQVIAHINEESINEYIAFKSLFFKKEEKNEKKGKDIKFIVTISIVSVLFVAISATLIIVIVRFNRKNKDLLNQVNAISFQNERISSANTFFDEENSNPNMLLD